MKFTLLKKEDYCSVAVIISTLLTSVFTFILAKYDDVLIGLCRRKYGLREVGILKRIRHRGH